MFKCLHCPALFSTQYLLNDHIRRNHQGTPGSPGWYENGTPQINDKGKVELTAIQHSLAAQREKMEKQHPISSPIPAPRPLPEQLIPSNGWRKTSNNTYIFKERIYEHTTPLDSIIIVLEANLNPKHGTCIEHKYMRDLRELNRLDEKRVVLESRMAQLVPSDPKYGAIAMELCDVTQLVNKLTRETKPDNVNHTLIIEDFYRFEPGDEQIKWMKEFMDKVNEQFNLLKDSYKEGQL